VTSRQRRILACLLVAAVAFAVFSKTLDHQFVNWDDDVYVTANPAIQPLSPERIGWIFSNFYYYAYIPVTILSHAADVAVWGLKPRGHHLTNVLLHTANAVWVFFLCLALFRKTPRPGVIGAALSSALFAIHPLRAESVSWISDRKDLLCAFFFLPGVMAYIRYASRRGSREGWVWYLASFVLFALAVLSKSVAVAFPVLLLLLDWLWLRGRPIPPVRILLEKVPFFAVSLVLAVLSLGVSPDAKRAYSIAHLTGAETFFYPFYSLTFSLYKTLLPIHLGPIYPGVSLTWMIAGLVGLVAVTGVCVLLAGRGRKGPLLAWLCYLLLLAPNVAGLSSGMQPVADRYSYLPTIGFFVLLGAAVAAAWENGGGRRRLALAAASVTLCVISARATVGQAAQWKSSISLWEPVVSGRPPEPDYIDAYLNLSAAYAHDGRAAEAREILGRAAAIDPSNAEVAYNLGILFYVEGNKEKALASFRRATENDPRHARAFFNLAIVSDDLGRDKEAVEAMVRAARLGSTDAQDAMRSRGLAW
jgi:protein O-mannosyl-transferase